MTAISATDIERVTHYAHVGPRKKICIIGAGPSGLGAAKIMLQAGHEVDVLEKTNQLGGIWAVAYAGARLQNSYHEYYFSDYPHPKQLELHPTKEYLLQYLRDYAEHFGVLPHIQYQHEVVHMEHMNGEKGKWNVQIKHNDHITTRIYDFIIIAKGQFYDNPIYPHAIYQEKQKFEKDRIFKGEIVHEREIQDLNKLRGKHVVTIGMGKTALDLACQSVDMGAHSTTLIYRSPRWMLPLYLLGVLHYTQILFARHGSYFMNSWYLHPTQYILQHYLSFIPYLFWRTLEMIILISHGTYMFTQKGRTLIPKERLEEALRSAIPVAPASLMPNFASGRLTHHQGEIIGFTHDSIILSTGIHIRCDLLISCCGYASDLTILPQYQHLASHDGLHLYRHIIHPDIPDLAFAGYNHSFLHIPGLELAMHWLLASWAGIHTLPSAEAQRTRITECCTFATKHILYEPTRSSTIGPRFFSHFDELCDDMGIAWNRHTNLISEYLVPRKCCDFKHISELIQQRYVELKINHAKKQT